MIPNLSEPPEAKVLIGKVICQTQEQPEEGNHKTTAKPAGNPVKAYVTYVTLQNHLRKPINTQ